SSLIQFFRTPERAGAEAGPLDLARWRRGLRNGLQLSGFHVGDRLLELVLEPGGDRIQVPDRRVADTVVGGVVREVAALLALVLEALDRVTGRVLEALLSAGHVAGPCVRGGLVLGGI